MATTVILSELKAARLRAAVSIALNLFLMTIKGVAAIKSESTALMGDAIHSGTDVFASASSFLGLWLAARQHPSFPYGLYKAETVATLVSAVAILVAGYEIGRQALLGPERLPDVALALPVALFALIVTLLFGFFQLRAGKRLHSPALVADARDYLTDALSTALVLFGLVATSFGWHLDRWAAAAVCLFVFRAGGVLLVSALRDLLDAAIDRESERRIIDLVEESPQVTRVDGCLSRTAAGRCIIDMDVVMHTPSQRVADRVAAQLEQEIVARFPQVIMARLRPLSSSADQRITVSPVTEPGGMISDHLGSAPWFLLEQMELRTGVVKRRYLENPHAAEKKKKGLLVGRWLLSMKPDRLLLAAGASRDGVALVLLREAGVEIVTARAASEIPGEEEKKM